MPQKTEGVHRILLRIFLFLTLLVSILPLVATLPSIIRIGGLFDSDDEEQEVAFRAAVEKINQDRAFLPQSKLLAQWDRLSKDDSFRATKKVCSLLNMGVAGIFGPQSDVTSMHAQSICDALDVPHVETRWDFQLQRDDLSINLFPRPCVLARAYVDLVRVWGWRTFCVVYEEHEGIIRLQDFFKEAQQNHWRIHMYQFTANQPYRDLFWKIKLTNVKNLVIDVRRENIYTVLKHAQQVGMMTETHSYLVTSLDLHTVEMEDFKYGKTNITGFRLVNEESPELSKLLSEWGRHVKKADPPPKTIKTETALVYDAVQMFAKALQELDKSRSVDFPPISCDTGIRGSDGTSIVNFMKSTTVTGLTGLVSFDLQGFRSIFVLDLMFLTQKGLTKIGTWSPDFGLNITSNVTSDYYNLLLRNKTLIVTTVENPPYTMLKKSPGKLSGNEQYEGYVVDLIEEISKILGFQYIFKRVDDGKYGGKTANGSWDGMVAEVISGKADIAVVDLTITSQREEVVDFTMPFMNTGISILFKKPTQKVTTLFSFLSPFSTEVWIYVIGAYLGVSVILFLVGRLSPYEWDNPHPCRQDNQVLENNFNLTNSMWFTIGSLMQQGSDLAPKAMSTRTVAGIWYFFTLIMISSYTANLAAFLTVERTIYPIESAEDLAKQTKIHYGCVGGGSTQAFFQYSKIGTYAKMWEFMSKRPEVFTKSNEEGQKKVLAGNYAFLMESASIEYRVERNCNLTQIGGLLDSKAYGIATRKNSDYRTPLSSAILKLQENGVLHELKEKWWKQKGGGQCPDDSKKASSSVTELGLGNVGGVFVVLLCGLTLAIMVAVVEFLWKARKRASEDREPLCKEMFKELKFALSCQSSTKSVRKSMSESNGDYRISTLPSFSTDY